MGLLRKIARDRSANVLAIGAASIIPLVGVIGGGVDASIAYLAKSRLQQACDAATLAARKKLAGSKVTAGVIPSDIVDTADGFFETNFPAGMYGTQNVNYTLSAGTATQMNGTASVDVPTTLMRVFGKDKISLDVSCSAELNLPNIDVVLVLDNSGSMSGTRIQGLRDAVFSFYDEVMGAAPTGTRIRIGLLPYNTSVHAGPMIMAQDPAYIANTYTYQSREAIFDLVGNDDGVEEGDVLTEEFSTELLPRNSVRLGSTNSAHYHWNETNKNKEDQCLAYSGTYTVGDVTWIISNPDWKKNYFPKNDKKYKAACMADIRKVTYATEGKPETFSKVFREYEYKPMSFATGAFKTGAKVTTPTGVLGADVESTWNGCIVEAQTVAATTYDPIPAGAFDMDIDLIPSSSSPATLWAPLWNKITFDRGQPAQVNSDTAINSHYADCPQEAAKLQEWPLSGGARNADFESAINGMVAGGATMHDIGMIWGGRMISPDGIFASDNASAPNGDPISRHIIFMTDGFMEPWPDRTHVYGDDDMEGRVAGFAADGTWNVDDIGLVHSNRLAAVCEQIKNKNVTIWSVAFGLPHTDFTRDCATGGAARAFTADNNAQLAARFKEIATSIAELRLVK